MYFTSGTTGRPKCALRTYVPAGVTADLASRLGYRESDEVQLVGGPLYHSGPLRHATMVQSLGGTVVLMPRFDVAQWLHHVETSGVTSAFLAPTMAKRIVSHPDAAAICPSSRLRCVLLSGGPTPMALKETAVACFGDGVVHENYGSTETGTNTHISPADLLRKPGSSGLPLADTELRILTAEGQPGEAGEIWVRSPMRVDRYVGTADRLRERDRFLTAGDIGYLDENGYLYVLDRRVDLILSGGVNVYPAEVEAVLHQHPGVADEAVFGIPSEEWGQVGHAVVEPRGTSRVATSDLEEHCRRFLAGYKVPRYLLRGS